MHVPRITVVLKFGGTSLADALGRDTASDRVSSALARGYAPVVVASAMGRGFAPYATDALKALAHVEDADRNLDLLLSCGEIISAATFASLLNHNGMNAVAMTGAQAGIITDATYGDANIVRVEPHEIQELVDRGIVPVVAGFQGITENGVVTTLGRGGSDMSAIAIGHALGAQRIDIYTDVSGVMTADPRQVAKAQRIDRLSHNEMTEFADRGAKVMNYKAARFARRRRTPYWIKGLHTDVGTSVGETGDQLPGVTGIAMQGSRLWVRLKHGDLSVFKRLAAANITAGLVTIDRSSLSFVVSNVAASTLRNVLNHEDAIVHVRENCAEIAIVGEGLRHMPNVMPTLVDAFAREDIELIHCAGGDLCVSAIVPAAQAETAERVLHDAFRLDVCRFSFQMRASPCR